MTDISHGAGLRAVVFRLRGAVWAAAFIVAWLAAHPTLSLLITAGVLVVTGHALRFWAAGYIPAYRGESLEAPWLATDGPYGFVRNPLYIANGLIGLGWSAPAGPVALAVFPILFVVLYGVVIVPHEEAFLAARFGTQYEHYRRTTGRWIPMGWPRGNEGGQRFDWRVARRAEFHSVWLNVLCTALIATRPLVPLAMP